MSEKNVGSEKVSEIFLFKNLFGTNAIYGLKILGPKKISGLEKFWVGKKWLKKNLRPKYFGSGNFFFWKKLRVQKKFWSEKNVKTNFGSEGNLSSKFFLGPIKFLF